MKKYDVVTFKDNEFTLDVRTDKTNETVWLTQEEIAKLFGKARSTITEHINNIFSSKELDKSTSVGFSDERVNNRPAKFYNLDVILAVGYRVNSKRGILFRKWANKILKDYLIQGYAVNERRLIALKKTIEIQNRMLSSTLEIDNQELVNVVNEYTNALDLLDDYDHQRIKKIKGHKDTYVLKYKDCRKIIDSMKFSNQSKLFGVEKEEGKLNGILAAVYQNVFGKEVYESLEDKAAHLLYFLIKDHPFIDGCKRIGATLFLEFLNKNGALVKKGKLLISNDALVAVTLLVAESKPEEMDIIVKIITNLLATF